MDFSTKATHSLLAPSSRGTYLSPAMRLVGMTMLLWHDEWKRMTQGRYGMDLDEIADRTSLTPKQVEHVLRKMEDIQLVRPRADGWELTVGPWLEGTLRAWREHSTLHGAPPTSTR